MKKNILFNVAMLLSFIIFVSCGSNTKEDPIPEEQFTFFNATTPLIIHEAIVVDTNGTKDTNETQSTGNEEIIDNVYRIRVQLLEFGLGVSGEVINMKPFNIKYGFVMQEAVVTDLNGYATFFYRLPEDFSAVKGKNITIQAVYLDYSQTTTASSSNSPKEVILSQDFVLQFR